MARNDPYAADEELDTQPDPASYFFHNFRSNRSLEMAAFIPTNKSLVYPSLGFSDLSRLHYS